MPTARYRLVPDGPIILKISWGFGWRNFAIHYDNQLVAIIEPKQLGKRNEYQLLDGSILAVRLICKAFSQELRLERNGQPLPGSVSDPSIRLQRAGGIIIFIGVANILLGLLSQVIESAWLRNIGINWYSIVLGFIFLGLGTLVLRKSQIALVIAVTIFAVDGLCGVLLLATSGNTAAISGIIISRILFLIPMINGFKAFPQVNKTKKSSAIPPDITKPTLPLEPSDLPTDTQPKPETLPRAKKLSIARVCAITFGVLLISFCPCGIALALFAQHIITDDAALAISVVSMIIGLVVCLTILLSFVMIRRIDLCPACSKPCFYHKHDTGKSLQCKRCKRIWTAGKERI